MATPGGIPEADWELAQKYGQMYGVDPLLLVAIGEHETGWGKLGDGRNGNILGVGSYDSGSTYQWAGVQNQLQKGAELLASHGVYSVADVRNGKARFWATDPNWSSAVAAQYDKLGGGGAVPSGGTGATIEPASFSFVDSIGNFFDAILSADFWKRVGKFLLGVLIVVASAYFMMEKQPGTRKIARVIRNVPA